MTNTVCADENPGYTVYDSAGGVVYTSELIATEHFSSYKGIGHRICSIFEKQAVIVYQDEGRTNMGEEKKNAVELDDQALGNNELTEGNLNKVAGGTDEQDNSPIVVYGPCPFCGNSYEKLIVDTRMHSVTKYGETCTLYICDKTKKEFFASRAGFYDLSLHPM